MLKPVPIGELLVERGLLDHATLQEAVQRQASLGDALGNMLASEGAVRPRDLYETLAQQKGLPFADLMNEPPLPELAMRDTAHAYLQYACIPWKYERDRLIVACARLDADTMEYLQRSYCATPFDIALTSPRDILRSVERLYGPVLDARAREHLLAHAPHYSLRSSGKSCGRLALAGFAAVAGACVFWPGTVLPAVIMLCNIVYFAAMLLKPVLFKYARAVPALPTQRMLDALPADRDLPVYTVLVPLYKEKESVRRLIASLCALDYPKSRLDVKLIVEEDDTSTIEAIMAAHPPAMFELLRVPYSLPRTKPKACNYALAFARGEFVTIYDAEDQPEPDQLKKSVAIFRAMPPEVVCLQARLNYYNRSENMLTRMFAIEYGGLFSFMLPGLQALHIPIPLGGTSNHLRLNRLREIGEWDPYNVTEDADLGIRLATEGQMTLPFDSLTLEEAPVLVSAWLKQRSRWIKGYMQTWRVAMRHAGTLYRRFGMAGFIGFQLFVGAASLIYLLAPLMWLVSGLWAVGAMPVAVVPSWVIFVSLAVFCCGIAVQWALAAVVVRELKWEGAGMRAAVALYPFYWVLHSVASFRALWQLFFAPYHWDKTQHGLSRHIPA